MFSRREFLKRSLAGSSLWALGNTVPGFMANTAFAAEHGRENILVVVELEGGNDGLNTVIPFADDLYHKARPTLRFNKDEVLRLDDEIGLNPSLSGLNDLYQDQQLAIVQGVGYPNPNRSHFDSMDIWQSADPRGKVRSGWLARGLSELQVRGGRIPAFHMGDDQLPLALQGSAIGVPSLNTEKPFGLDLLDEFYGHQPDGSRETRRPIKRKSKNKQPQDSDKSEAAQAISDAGTRKGLIEDLTRLAPESGGGLLQFVRKTSLQTYTTIDRLAEIMSEDVQVPDAEFDFSDGNYRQLRSGLKYELLLIARMIQAGLGTRIFYVSMDGFDTHSEQRQGHNQLLDKLGSAVQTFFQELKSTGDAERVVLMTFSEFGRRVSENGSKGTDHGAGSCLFVAGPAVKGGLVGRHPSLAPADLDSGDLRHHTDFRRVYATILDRWLGCASRHVLGGEFPYVELFSDKS